MVPNLFLAARPFPDDAAVITRQREDLQRTHGLRGRVVKPENLHVTLVEFTGVREHEETVLQKTLAAARRIDMPAFEVVFDRALSFSGRDGPPLVLTGGDGVLGLSVLQAALIAALHKEWLKIPAKPHYTPHMTLLYADRAIADVPIAPLRWTVAEFLFIRSLPGKSTHLTLDRWALRR